MPPATPDIAEVRRLAGRLAPWLLRTPVLRCRNLEARLGRGLSITGKLEFLQRTGTFKPRGALSTMLDLDEQARAAGVTAVSAGNHAVATAFAARALGTSAKVVMTRSANPARIAACRHYGAEVVLADDIREAFATVDALVRTEGRHFVHPFEGEAVIRGTATVGLEICEQVDGFDAIVIPIGGGGLCAGIASVVRQLRPDCEIYGVEPEGADTMHRSFASGRPEAIDEVRTIADSLGAPFALPLSFELCRANLDRLVRVSDDELRAAMRMLFLDMKMAVEPACAATTAALAGPLAEALDGKRVVLVFCGSNSDWATWEHQAWPEIASAD
ncbi:MAG TPA: threonine/serine dehydratase [Woeseiaceae bacterium]|nr:threonine/serine dehydratase [Woeseiaceae bacterium]